MTAPLNTHIQNNLIEMVKEKLLLERITLNGVDVNRRDNEGNNALYWAIKKQSTHNANLLVSFGSSLVVHEQKHALFHAIECGHHQMVVLLLEKGLDVNLTDDVGKTALMYAVESEVFETVKYIISKGADMYILDNALNMAEDYVKACNCGLIKGFILHVIYRNMQENPCQTSCKCN